MRNGPGVWPLLMLMLCCRFGYAAQKHQLDIPQGNLTDALNTLAIQVGVLLQYDPQLVGQHQTSGIKGEYDLDKGFSLLLSETGLYAEQLEDGSYILRAVTQGAEQVLLDTLDVYTSRQSHTQVYEAASSDAKVDLQQMERIAPRDTSDIFYSVAGVSTSQSRQEPGVSVNVRGVQDFGRINVTIDGARQNFQRSGHGANGSVYLDPQLLSSVDIAKGPVASAGGGGAIGGVVNFNTLEFADLAKPGSEAGSRISLTSGSNAYHFQGNAATAFKLDPDWDVVAAVGRKNIGQFEKGQHGGNAGNQDYFDSISAFTSQQHWSSLFKTHYRFSPEHSAKLSYIGFFTEFEEGSATDQNAEPESTSKLDNHTYKLDYAWTPDSSLFDLSASVYFNRTRIRQHQFETGESDNPYGEFALEYETNTFGFALENLSYFELSHFGLDEAESLLLLNTGVEYFRDWTQPQAVQQTPGTGDPAWFTGATPEGSRSLSSGFVQAEWQYGDALSLELGVRYDHFSLEGDGEIYSGSILNPAGVSPSHTLLYSDFEVARNKGYFSPNLKFAYRVTDYLQVYLGSASGVRPPSITETLLFGSHVGNSFPFYPNPGLKTERSRNTELGLNLELKDLAQGHDVMLKGAWFENRVKDFIVQGQVMRPTSVDDNSMTVGYVNLEDRILFRGFELQADYNSQYVFAELTYTRMNLDLGQGGYDPFPLGSQVGFPETTLGQPDSGSLLYIPPAKHSGALVLGLKLWDDKLKMGARLRFEDNDGRGGKAYEDVVDWEVYDLWLEYKHSDALSARLSVDNLRDLNYAEANGTSYWIAPGRTLTARITSRF